ncbi:MAG TPA: hypothetical protein VGC79_22350 [Polyangiaceae bacterium]
MIAVLGPAVSLSQDRVEPEGPFPGDWPGELNWHEIAGFERTVVTRFGEVAVSYVGEELEGRNPKVEIRFNGDLVKPPMSRSGDFGIVAIREVFMLADHVVVLLAATAGGSGSPPPLLLLLTVDAQGESDLVIDPQFRSMDWTERVASSGVRLYFNLGYQDGKRKTAVYEDNRIEVSFADAEPVPLPGDTCRRLYESVSNGLCALGQPFSQAVVRSLRALDNRPGFESQRIVRACEIAKEVGEAPPYPTFQSDVCGVRR